jgi:hypothetical protein
LVRSRRKLGFEALDVRARPLLTVDGNLGVAWTDPKLEDPSFRRSLISLISVRHACRRAGVRGACTCPGAAVAAPGAASDTLFTIPAMGPDQRVAYGWWTGELRERRAA